MLVYYNEIDDFCCSWLSNLMDDGSISPGKIDNRDIRDVTPVELTHYERAHFFAGIGVWELALNISGWSGPIWTGSCPCQPFSAAGKGDGFDDERHLWPAFHWHITHGKSADVPVVGEQVASKAGRAWFDLVQSDMEALDHACGAVDTSAAGNGAPFIGQRLYWLGSTHRAGLERYTGDGSGERRWSISDRPIAASGSGQCDRWAATTGGHNCGGSDTGWSQGDGRLAACDDSGGLAPPTSGEPWQAGSIQSSGQYGCESQDVRDCGDGGIPLHPTDFWSDPDWLLCRDPDGARFRPVEPSTLIMANARPVRWRMAEGSGEGGEIQTHFPLAQAKEYLNRLDEVRGAGNALNVAQAANFISAVMEYLGQ